MNKSEVCQELYHETAKTFRAKRKSVNSVMNSRTKSFFKSQNVLINMTKHLGVYSHISLESNCCFKSVKSDFQKKSR